MSQPKIRNDSCLHFEAWDSYLELCPLNSIADLSPCMRHYPSKLLLFGEYILLLGESALATPVAMFGGQWVSADRRKPDEQVVSLSAFANSEHLEAIEYLDTAQFQKDVANGLFFRSSIPQGYGLGSSGALCAAVYDRYAQVKTNKLPALRAQFARMESFFHGKSSGIDPLTSYLNRALLVRGGDFVRIFEAPPWPNAIPVVFLLDTKMPRQTGPLVDWFLQQYQKGDFLQKIENTLLPAHRLLLQAWEERVASDFWDALFHVAKFQLENMQPMIPAEFKPVWAKCLAGGDILLKICGAGGGGFILGFAKSKAAALNNLNQYDLIFPFEKHELVEK